MRPDVVSDLAEALAQIPSYGRIEPSLRRLLGRRDMFRGHVLGVVRGWVSRETRFQLLAARFLDFVVLTEQHLVLLSTGFFSRQPKRVVLREPLVRLTVTARGRALRVVGDQSKHILIELRPVPGAEELVEDLLARTKPAIDRPAGRLPSAFDPPPALPVDDQPPPS